MGIYRLCFSRLLEKSRMSKQLQPDAAFANSADYESTTSGPEGIQGQAHSETIMKREKSFVVCIVNKGYGASLELRKLYEVIPDEAAGKLHQIRVVDESGEDYLYPEEYFVPVHLPHAAERAVLRAR
jgi:hypothetical protein